MELQRINRAVGMVSFVNVCRAKEDEDLNRRERSTGSV